MKTIDLELRVSTKGTILSYEVYLNDAMPASKVMNHNSPSTKKFPAYSAQDTGVKVIVKCGGVNDSETTCTVLINGQEQAYKVTKIANQPGYESHTYPV